MGSGPGEEDLSAWALDLALGREMRHPTGVRSDVVRLGSSSIGCQAVASVDASTYFMQIQIFRGLRPEAGNAGSHGDLSHIPLEVLELQLRSAHVRPPKPSPKV